MAIAWYYDESKHPGGGANIPGVPLADLTDEDFAAQPAHAQRAIEQSDMYRKTKPRPAPKAKPETAPASANEASAEQAAPKQEG